MTDFLRQLDIVDPKKIVYPATCIGLGGIGSFTVTALRKMGFREFLLYDHDTVEPHNIPSQDYRPAELGQLKVLATAENLRSLSDDSPFIIRADRKFAENDRLEGIVIAGVDNMSSRKTIWNAVQKSCGMVPLFVDGRIGIDWDEQEKKVRGEWIEVFTVNPASISDVELYESHLFPEEDAAPFHCTAQAVVYVSYLIAGFIVSHVGKWVSGNEFPRYLLFDCLTSTTISAIK